MAARQQAEAARAAADEAGSRYLPRATLSENFAWTDEPAGSLFISLNQEDLRLSSSADTYHFPPSRKDFETRLTVEQPLYDPDIAYGRRRAEKGAEAALAGAEWSAEQAAFAPSGPPECSGPSRAGVERKFVARGRRGGSPATERHAAGVGLRPICCGRCPAVRGLAAPDHNEKRPDPGPPGLALAMGRENGKWRSPAPAAEQLAAPARRCTACRPAAAAHEAEEAGSPGAEPRRLSAPRRRLRSYAARCEVPFGTDAGSWAVRAGLSWELFDGGRRGHSSRGAAARKQVAESRRLEAARQVQFLAEEAQLRATEAKENLETARQSVAEAEESQRLLRERYAAGLAELAELLAAQSPSTRRSCCREAESRLVLARRIRFQSGTFLQTFLPREERSP
jgi:hypothetical protein